MEIGRNEMDYVEIGDTGLIPLEDGWFQDKHTGNKIDPEGREFTEDGDPVDDGGYDG